eukprot:364617-Chlamydomonas_euryale.AAC.2
MEGKEGEGRGRWRLPVRNQSQGPLQALTNDGVSNAVLQTRCCLFAVFLRARCAVASSAIQQAGPRPNWPWRTANFCYLVLSLAEGSLLTFHNCVNFTAVTLYIVVLLTSCAGGRPKTPSRVSPGKEGACPLVDDPHLWACLLAADDMCDCGCALGVLACGA